MKKMICVLLSVIMLCSAFSCLQTVSFATALPISGQCGENVFYSFDAENGVLTIRGSGDTFDYYSVNYHSDDHDSYYTFNSNSPFRNNNTITDVIIKEGVTSIGSGLFWECHHLQSVSCANSVCCIGIAAFFHCSELESITIPSSVTSIGYDAFSGCVNLNTINYLGDVEQWTQITGVDFSLLNRYAIENYHFNGNQLEKELVLSSFEKINAAAFRNNPNIEKLIITGNVKEIEQYAFCDCSNLKSIYINSSVNTVSVTSFANCRQLETVCIPGNISVNQEVNHVEKDSFSGVSFERSTTSGKLFSGCPISSLSFCDNPSSITSFWNYLFKTETLKSFDVPDGVQYIGDAAFKDCNNLLSVTIPKSVTRIEYNAFSGCTNLVIKGYVGSYAETFCNLTGIPFEAIVEPHVHDYQKTIKSPQKTSLGFSEYKCACGDSYKSDFTAPTGKIGGFKCKTRTANAETVQWSGVKSASGYQVQISTKDGKKWDKYYNLKAGVTNYTFKSLAAGNAYKFRVRFFIKAADGKAYYSPWSSTLTSPTLPTGTSLTKVTAGSKAFTANWKKNAAVNGYQIQYSLKSNFSGAKTVTVKSNKTLKTTVKKLNAKKVYYVRVRTYKTIAKVNYFSAWSKAVKVKTK